MAVAALGLSLSIAGGIALAAKGDTILISQGTGNAPAADEESHSAAVSDGRWVAFTSDAANLTDQDDEEVANVNDVFLYDTQADELVLASKTSAGDPAQDGSGDPSISANGRWVAFTSGANNLSDDDYDVAPTNVFVHDRTTGETSTASLDAPGEPLDWQSLRPSISPDGRFVAFETFADNLTNAAQDDVKNVVLFDEKFGTTILVSRNGGAGGGGDFGVNDDASDASVAKNGKFVAFSTSATNMPGNQDDAVEDVYVKPVRLLSQGPGPDNPELASRTTGNQGGDADSGFPSISADGRFTAFHSAASLVAADTNDDTDVYMFDRKLNRQFLVSRETKKGPVGDNDSLFPSVSGSGRYVAFQSLASNLSGADSPAAYSDIFVYDHKTGKLKLASKKSDGTASLAGHSTIPSISDNGAYVGFTSEANSLSDDDDDAFTNVFRHQFLGE